MTINYCDCCGKRLKEWFSFNSPIFKNESFEINPSKKSREMVMHPYQLCEECVEKMNSARQLGIGDNSDD